MAVNRSLRVKVIQQVAGRIYNVYDQAKLLFSARVNVLLLLHFLNSGKGDAQMVNMRIKFAISREMEVTDQGIGASADQ